MKLKKTMADVTVFRPAHQTYFVRTADLCWGQYAAQEANGQFGDDARQRHALGSMTGSGREQRICPVMVPRNAAEWRSVTARLSRPEVQTGVIQATAISDGIERLRDVGPISTIAEKIPHAEKG